MDYGQPVKQDNSQPFFTADSGVDYEKVPNLENDETENSWDVSPDRDPGKIGNTAIFSPEIQPEASEESEGVVSLAMPPGEEPPLQVSNPELDQTTTVLPSHDLAEIKTTEKLNFVAIKATDDAINKFYKDGDASDFYNKIRGEGGLRDLNLKNSYGREVGKE